MKRFLTVCSALLLSGSLLAVGQVGERDGRKPGDKPPGSPGKPGKERPPRGERDGPRGGERRGPGPGPGRGGRPHADHFLATHDLDGDKLVTFAEFQKSEKVARIPEEGRKRIFDHLDKNKDGKISRDELPKSRGDGGPKWGDLNGDGKITKDEFLKNPRARAEMFERMDHNKDGVLTRDDFRRRSRGPFFDRATLAKLDTDGDKALTFEEWKKHPRLKDVEAKRLREIFGRLDRNDDGKLNEKDKPDRPRPGPRPSGPGGPLPGPPGGPQP